MENTPRKKTRARRAADGGSAGSGSSGAGTSKPGTSSAGRTSTTAKSRKGQSKSSSGTKAAASDLTQIQISVADDYISRFDDVVGRVKKLGFKPEQELPDIGIIVGQMPAERVSELGQVEGVGDFERPRSYQLPPPESDLQ